MDNRTMMVRATNWARIIEECNNSGKTVAEFCKEHNIAKLTYYLWQQRIRGMIPDKANGITNLMTVGDESSFAEISVSVRNTGSFADVCPTVEINIGSTTIKLSNSVSPELLNNLWKVIQNAE